MHSRGDAGLGADRLADPRRRGAAAAAPPRRGPPQPAGQAGTGQGRRAARLAGRRTGAAVRSRRAAAVVPRHLRRRPAGPDQRRRLPLHQGTVILAVDRDAAAGQVRPQAPRLPRRDAGRRRRAGVHARPDRPAQDDPPGHLLLAHPPRLQPRAADRAGQGAAAARAGHRGGRVQLRLPRHPPPRRPGRAGKALRPPPLPAHPRRPDLLRPGPRHRRHGVRQRRHHHGRTGQGDHRLRGLLAAGHRQRSRPAGLRFPADHLQDPRRAVRPRHPVAHPAPARQDRTGPPGRPARLGMEDRRYRPLRPLPRPRLHEDLVRIKDISGKVRQIAVTNC